jgi:hypothetical protein
MEGRNRATEAEHPSPEEGFGRFGPAIEDHRQRQIGIAKFWAGHGRAPTGLIADRFGGRMAGTAAADLAFSQQAGLPVSSF